MKLQIELNEVATATWNKVSGLPEFAMSTKAGIIYQMMHHYLNPQSANRVVSGKPAEPETPVIGKVELRQQAEREEKLSKRAARLEAMVEQARNYMMDWPTRAVGMPLDSDGGVMYLFPNGTTTAWTPPDDYPPELVDKANREEAIWKAAMAGRPVDTDPPPIPEDYDTEAEYAEARVAWGARQNFAS